MTHDLRRLKRAQQPAPEIGQELQLAVCADERPFALRRLKVRADAREQLARARRLDDVIVRPGGEGFDLAILFIARREDDERQLLGLRLRAQQAAEREPVNAGNLYI